MPLGVRSIPGFDQALTTVLFAFNLPPTTSLFAHVLYGVQFSVNNFRTHVQDTVHHDISVFLKLANDISSRRAQVNLPDIFFRFTLDTFGIMAFGADLECLPYVPHPCSLYYLPGSTFAHRT